MMFPIQQQLARGSYHRRSQSVATVFAIVSSAFREFGYSDDMRMVYIFGEVEGGCLFKWGSTLLASFESTIGYCKTQNE
jgi:hypothetical protein